MEKNQEVTHWKNGNIYTFLADALPASAKRNDRIQGMLIAKHHETLEDIKFVEGEEGHWYAEASEEGYTLYRNAAGVDFARESFDFHGFKQKEDGTTVKRFVAAGKEAFQEQGDETVTVTVKEEDGKKIVKDVKIPEEQKYQAPEVDIEVPDNYVVIVDESIRKYKHWLEESLQLQQRADEAETDEEREKALEARTRHLKERFGGILAKDQGDRLSTSQVRNIWKKFMRFEYRDFLKAHTNLSLEEILFVGVDKFVYVLGFKKPSDVHKWRNNKVRVGVCCHCKDQFIPMMMQYNHGLCSNCKPIFSHAAIRNFIIHQLHESDRYHEAHRDMLMDFYIMFYHNDSFRNLFIVGTPSAAEYEAFDEEVPEWVERPGGAVAMDE